MIITQIYVRNITDTVSLVAQPGTIGRLCYPDRPVGFFVIDCLVFSVGRAKVVLQKQDGVWYSSAGFRGFEVLVFDRKCATPVQPVDSEIDCHMEPTIEEYDTMKLTNSEYWRKTIEHQLEEIHKRQNAMPVRTFDKIFRFVS